MDTVVRWLLLEHISLTDQNKARSRSLGTGYCGCNCVVRDDPCKVRAHSEGMRSPFHHTPNPTLPSLCASIFLLNQLVFLFYSDLILPMLC